MLSRSQRHRTGALIGLAVLATLGAGCAGGNSVTRGELVNQWIHSHEEDSADVQTFRPSTYAFPLSRGREAWDFRADGSVVHRTIAAADGYDESKGRWSMSDEGLLTIQIEAVERPLRFNVVALDSAVLKLQILR